MNRERLRQTLKRHEGAVRIGGRHTVYKDSLGLETIGYGRLLSRGLSDDEAEYLLEKDITECVRAAREYPWFAGLDDVRQEVIVNMIFNLGAARFSRFVKTHQAISRGDFEWAAREMLDSLWATQVRRRANELAEQMRRGDSSIPRG